MKKLLAIAVVAAMTAPAMADTSVYGSMRGLIGKSGDYSGTIPGSTVGVAAAGTNNLAAGDNGSRLGFKGSNTIDNGLAITHQFELRADMTGTANAVNTGYINVGVKGGFGHVQLGQVDTVMDDVDGGANFLTNGSYAVQPGDGTSQGQLKYTGSFGPVTVLASTRLKGNRTAGQTKNQFGLTYKAGPFKVGVGTASALTTGTGRDLAKTKIALSYAGANYGVGLVHAEDNNTVKTKSNTLGGKYSFGKAYVAASIGKSKQGPITKKQNDFELGYSLAKSTKVYLQLKKHTRSGVTTAKATQVGFQHNF